MNDFLNVYFSSIITGILIVIALEIIVGITLILRKLSKRGSKNTRLSTREKRNREKPSAVNEQTGDLEIIDFDENEYKFL